MIKITQCPVYNFEEMVASPGDMHSISVNGTYVIAPDGDRICRFKIVGDNEYVAHWNCSEYPEYSEGTYPLNVDAFIDSIPSPDSHNATEDEMEEFDLDMELIRRTFKILNKSLEHSIS